MGTEYYRHVYIGFKSRTQPSDASRINMGQASKFIELLYRLLWTIVGCFKADCFQDMRCSEAA